MKERSATAKSQLKLALTKTSVRVPKEVRAALVNALSELLMGVAMKSARRVKDEIVETHR
jgi:hypothetical protein